jgi:hypothetical protein
MSMGGYLAPRAAAFDKRIDGVVAFDVFFDYGAISSRSVPPGTFWFGRHGMGFVLNAIAKLKAVFSPSLRWALQNSQWVMGMHDPLEVVEALRAYTLQGVAQRIECDVLIFAGEEDHFVPFEQLKQFESSLTRPAALRLSATTANPAAPNIVSSAPLRSGMRPCSIGCLRDSRNSGLARTFRQYRISRAVQASEAVGVAFGVDGRYWTGCGLVLETAPPYPRCLSACRGQHWMRFTGPGPVRR